MTDDSHVYEPSSDRFVSPAYESLSHRSIAVASAIVDLSVVIFICLLVIAFLAIPAGDDATVSVAISLVALIIFLAAVTVAVAVVVAVAFSIFVVPSVANSALRLRYVLRQSGPIVPLALAVWIGGRSRRWQAEPWGVDLTTSPRPIRYSLGLVVAATRMRLYDLGGLLVKAARWVLATDTRTWTPLIGLLLWGGIETALDTGPGTAILLVVSSGAVFHTGVTLGRKRLGVEVRRRKAAEQPDSPAGP